jgi:trimeric autotransporter adhesin
MAIGSHLEDSEAKGINGNQSGTEAEDSGAMYVYMRGTPWRYENGVTSVWRPAAYVKASNTQSAAEFGLSVALSGDGKVLAVGAPKENGTGKGVTTLAAGAISSNAKPAAKGKQATTMTNSGAVYVYY